MLVDSLIVSSITILNTLPVAIVAAYAFSRFRFRGSDLLLVWVLATQFLPPVVVLLPFYNLFRWPFGWLPESWLEVSFFDNLSRFTLLDTYGALIILNSSICPAWAAAPTGASPCAGDFSVRMAAPAVTVRPPVAGSMSSTSPSPPARRDVR